ncbi:MAG: hypothetical protein E6063_00795 [Atopobium sp.]|nr:hypothetical protein [Atopobium sp.]
MKPTIDLDAARNKLVGGKDQLLKKIDEAHIPANAQSIISAAGDALSATAKGVADNAIETASNVSKAVTDGVNVIKENTPAARRKQARMSGFGDGIKQGAYLAGTKRFNFLYAYVATMCYFLRADGEFSSQEQLWVEEQLDNLQLGFTLPEAVKDKLLSIIADDSLTFDAVKEFLEPVEVSQLESISQKVQIAIEIDEEITEEELAANELFNTYITERVANDIVNDQRVKEIISSAVKEYGENLDRIDYEFKQLTKLQDSDAAFVFGATAFQILRIILINRLTKIELAGKGSLETSLKDLQKKIFDPLDKTPGENRPLYASKHHILTNRGVPYDATSFADFNNDMFKGANHRFGTLGHDPLLGLIFGTANIMTNTITCPPINSIFKGIDLFPKTFNVTYDIGGKNPHIVSADPFGVSAQFLTPLMLASAANRILVEPDAAAAALIKQIIHIGTDLYTPMGIQLPFANLILDKATTERLTSYVNMGDIVKVGGQAAAAIAINWLVAALHGCSLFNKDDGTEFCSEMHQVRTKKILLISNSIATSSSVIQAAITKNPRNLDIGGAAVLIYRLFTDTKFISKLKQEFMTSELAKVYDQRVQGLL